MNQDPHDAGGPVRLGRSDPLSSVAYIRAGLDPVAVDVDDVRVLWHSQSTPPQSPEDAKEEFVAVGRGRCRRLYPNLSECRFMGGCPVWNRRPAALIGVGSADQRYPAVPKR